MDFTGSNMLILGILIVVTFGIEMYVLSKMYDVSLYERSYYKK